MENNQPEELESGWVGFVKYKIIMHDEQDFEIISDLGTFYADQYGKVWCYFIKAVEAEEERLYTAMRDERRYL